MQSILFLPRAIPMPDGSKKSVIACKVDHVANPMTGVPSIEVAFYGASLLVDEYSCCWVIGKGVAFDAMVAAYDSNPDFIDLR